VAPRLSELPVRAKVVFVVDASYSVGDARLGAELATLRAYASHLSDAEFEVVAYRRRAVRLFNAFVPASELDARLWKAVSANALALGNGSALDEGARVAASALADRTGPRRVVLLTDELLRSSLPPAAALRSLAAIPSDAVVHVVVPELDHDDRVGLERDDKHPLARLATSHHGILAHLRGLPAKAEKDLVPVVLELVRPTRIEHLAATGVTLENTTLHEGDGVRVWASGKRVPMRVVLAGQLWSDWKRRTVDATPEFSKATAAFVFGAGQHDDLSAAEMMRIALIGRAVSPVTSYVAAEPGTRPSTIGLDLEGRGAAGDGYGAGSVSVFGMGAPRVRPNLATMIDTSACVAAHHPASGWRVTLEVETTLDEIVDVSTDDKSGFAGCLVEATWSVRLDGRFDQTREKFAVELRGG
jgi:hypothetical protein